MTERWLCIVIGSLIFAIPARTAGPPGSPPRPGVSDILPLLSASSPDALAGAIRGCLVQSLPNPLYEARPNWGNTSRAARGLKWEGLHPEIQYSPKNDGKWRHICVTALSPADTLIFDVRDVQQPEPGRVTFSVSLGFDARIEYEQQNWHNGLRTYSGSAQARFRARAALACEFTYRVEVGDLLLPEAVVRLRVVKSAVSYDNFKTEHVAGVGGEAAEVLGSAIHNGLNKWHPGLERNLLARANAAMEKSADTKEVRLTLGQLLKKQGWLKAPAAPPSPPMPPTPPTEPSSGQPPP